jgi:PAS domain S-box-containing protein
MQIFSQMIPIPDEILFRHYHLMVIEADGTVISWNEKWKEIIPSDPHNVFTLFEWEEESEQQSFQNRFQAIASQPGQSFSATLKIISRHQRARYFDGVFYSFSDSGKNHIFLYARDESEKINLINRLMFAYENTPDVMYEMDISNRCYNYVSPACREVLEVDPEEVIRLKPGSLECNIHPEDLLNVRDHFRKILKTPGRHKQRFVIRYRYQGSRGIKWLVDRHVVFYHSSGEPYLLIGSIRDVTDTQIAMEKLLQSENLFRSIVENSMDIISMIDRQGLIRFVSPSIYDILGYKPEELIGKHPFEFMDSSMHDEVRRVMQQLLEHPGQVVESEMYFRYQSGRHVFLKSRFVNYLSHPHIQAIIGSTQDITKQKLMEKKLRESICRLEATIENMDDPAWALDPDLRLMYFNQAFSKMIYRLFGFKPEAGMALYDAVQMAGYPDHIECREKFLQAMKGESVRFEKVYQMNGSDVIMDYRISPITEGDGNIIGAYCLGRDITDMVTLNRKLHEQNEALERANRELNRFIYSMSHDLRSPITSSLGLVNLILQECQEEETIRHATMLNKRLNRLDQLIHEILDFVRQRNEQTQIEPINLAELVQQIVESRGYFEEFPHTTFKTGSDLTISVYAERRKLETVLENLLSNAFKYRDASKPQHVIELTARKEEQKVIFCIRDNGIGIASHHLSRIFDMFFRASSSSDGMGLGLYIVRQLLHSMDSTIEVESRPMEGTVFTVHLDQSKYLLQQTRLVSHATQPNYLDR